MTKDDILAALRGKPTPFEVGGVTVHLRPMPHAARSELVAWTAAHKDEPAAGLAVQRKAVAATLTSEDGAARLTEAEVAELDSALVDAIAAEVSRRAGLAGDGADRGKVPSPTTPSSNSPSGSPSTPGGSSAS